MPFHGGLPGPPAPSCHQAVPSHRPWPFPSASRQVAAFMLDSEQGELTKTAVCPTNLHILVWCSPATDIQSPGLCPQVDSCVPSSVLLIPLIPYDPCLSFQADGPQQASDSPPAQFLFLFLSFSCHPAHLGGVGGRRGELQTRARAGPRSSDNMWICGLHSTNGGPEDDAECRLLVTAAILGPSLASAAKSIQNNRSFGSLPAPAPAP